MKRVLFHDKQLADIEEMLAIGQLEAENFQEMLDSFFFTGFTVFNGFEISESTTPNGGVRLGLSLGLQNGKIINIGSNQNINIVSDIGGWGTAQAAHGSLNRYSIVCIKHDNRNTTLVEKWFINDTEDPPIEYQQSVNTRIEDYFEITVVHGIAGSSPAVPDTPAGYEKLAEIFVGANVTTITNANITNTSPDSIDTIEDVINSLNSHKTAATLDHPDNSVTDAKIGNRTISDTNAPTGDSGLLTTLFGWIGNMIKAITGKSSWRTAPATTLEAANTHHGASAPHSGHAATNHNLVNTTHHPASGLTNGHFLKATGATTYAFGAHGLTKSDVGLGNVDDLQQAPKTHNLINTTDHPVTGLTTGHFLKALTATTYGFAAHGLTKTDIGLGNVTDDAQLPLSGGTLSGNVNLADNQLIRPEIKDYAETATTANTGTTYTINLENGNVFNLTLTGNCTFTFSNPPASGKAGSFTLILKQDGTGGRSVTYPASVRWAYGVTPEISEDANAVDILTFFTTDGGTNWYGFLSGGDFS